MSSTPHIRLLLADVDGTLITNDKVLTEAAAAAVHSLHDAGIAFAITSGRPPRGMQMLTKPLALTTPIAGFNGGAFVNADMSVIETRTLSAEAARTALDIITKAGLDAWVYTAEDWMVRDVKAPHVDREAWTVKFAPKVVTEFTDEHLSHAVKIVGISDDLGKVEAAEQTAQKELGKNAAAARSQPYYLDVTHPDANKGGVADRLSELLHIPRENIATIGDQPNDVLMFKRSGMSIAMGNASDAVKASATNVTDGNENEGFAAAVRRFILPASAGAAGTGS